MLVACGGSQDISSKISSVDGFEEDLLTELPEVSSDESIIDSSPKSLCDQEFLFNDIPELSESSDGEQVFQELASKVGTARDAEIQKQAACGKMPRKQFQLSPITIAANGTEITFCVSPDYFSLGADSSFLRVPMGLPATYELFGALGFMLPTAKMVDLIYEEADLKVTPLFKPAGPQMGTTQYIAEHSEDIDSQIGTQSFELIGGHKKDVVITNQLVSRPNRIAIYGWHQLNGNPVQPLSTIHHLNYTDYSQGLRLVSEIAFLGETPVSLKDLLSSNEWSSYLSGEGPIAQSVLNNFSAGQLNCD